MKVILAPRVAVVEAQLRPTVRLVIERLGRPDGQVPIPSSTVGKIQALGAAHLCAVLLEVMLECTGNSFLLCGRIAMPTCRLQI
jgi:hypothetical protein